VSETVAADRISRTMPSSRLASVPMTRWRLAIDWSMSSALAETVRPRSAIPLTIRPRSVWRPSTAVASSCTNRPSASLSMSSASRVNWSSTSEISAGTRTRARGIRAPDSS
jgi:hypothetical protein